MAFAVNAESSAGATPLELDIGTVSDSSSANYDVSSATGTLVHRPDRRIQRRLFRVDSSGTATDLGLPAGEYSSPVLSGDATKLLVRLGDVLQMIDMVSGEMSTVAVAAGAFAWAPDGAMLYERETEGGWAELVHRAEDGSTRRLLPRAGFARSGGLSWAGRLLDGRWLVYVDDWDSESDLRPLTLLDVDSGEDGAVLGDPTGPGRWMGDMPAVSPDGQHLAFAEGPFDDGASWRMTVVALPALEVVARLPAVSAHSAQWGDAETLYLLADGKLKQWRPFDSTPDVIDVFEELRVRPAVPLGQKPFTVVAPVGLAPRGRSYGLGAAPGEFIIVRSVNDVPTTLEITRGWVDIAVLPRLSGSE